MTVHWCGLRCVRGKEPAVAADPGSMSCLQRSNMASTLRIARGRGSVRQWFLGAIALSPPGLVSRIAKSSLS
jgi:hypothetical protein